MKYLAFILALFVIIHINAQDPGFHIEPDHNVLFGDSMSGPGTKLMWIPSKHTLLAGNVDGNQWDIDSIGSYSAVFGENNQNKGKYNILWGVNNTIGSGVRFTQVGGLNNTIGSDAEYAQVGGSNNTIGSNADHVQVGGFGNTIGSGARHAQVWGLGNTIGFLAYYAQVGGRNNTIGSFAHYAQVGGHGNKALSSYEQILGRYADTTVTTDAATWDDTQQLFAIGNGTRDSDRNNALTVLKSGKMGINTNTIGVGDEMHIKGNTVSNPLGSRIRITRTDNGLSGMVNQNNQKAYFVGLHKGDEGIWCVYDDTAMETRLSIDSAGNMGIGKVVSLGNAIEHSNGAALSTAGVWTNSSDLSKKKEVDFISYGIKDIMALRPVSYKYKKDDSKSFGFIAQELELIFPELVFGEDGNKSVAYSLLTAVITRAIQEQQAIIDTQQAQLSQQELENVTLKSRIEKLELLVNGLIAQQE